MTILHFCETLFLFADLEKRTLQQLLDASVCETATFTRRQTIFAPCDYEKKIGFILRGECEVLHRRRNGESVRLNTLREGDSFGILTLFSEKTRYPTEIIAKKQTIVLFFSKEDVQHMMRSCPQISTNIIRFLSDRVDFLNQKVATLSGGSVEEKLAQFLLLAARRGQTVEIPFNAKKTAESINCARGSLYRALESLRLEGLIQPENKKIIIISPEGLERMTT